MSSHNFLFVCVCVCSMKVKTSVEKYSQSTMALLLLLLQTLLKIAGTERESIKVIALLSTRWGTLIKIYEDIGQKGYRACYCAPVCVYVRCC